MAAARRLLDRAEPPTAILLQRPAGDLRHARHSRVRSPRTIPKCPWSASTTFLCPPFTDPPLTTIRQPKLEMGFLAGEVLLKLLGGEKPESRVTTGELVIRESTARPACAAQSARPA